MRFRLLLPMLLLAALLVAPASAPAKSRYKVGIGDQDVNVFQKPAFSDLKLKRIRYLVPWDWSKYEYSRAEVSGFLTTARGQGFEPFVHFTASRGCWNGKSYSKKKSCRKPSVSAYTKSFKALRKQFPFLKVFGAWNEANHKSQPTYKSPKLAAQYYNALRKSCRKCTIVAADLLDSSNLVKYYKSFKRHAKSPKIWGLHNYSDVNRKRPIKTKQLLKIAKGQVWLTETGGIVSFTKKFPYSTSRAKSRTAYLFKLADTYSRKRKGLKSTITRIYPYQFTGVPKGSRFDAGLVDEHGKPRPAYKTFKAALKKRSR
jgi:hypothetical protein